MFEISKIHNIGLLRYSWIRKYRYSWIRKYIAGLENKDIAGLENIDIAGLENFVCLWQRRISFVVGHPVRLRTFPGLGRNQPQTTLLLHQIFIIERYLEVWKKQNKIKSFQLYTFVELKDIKINFK